MVTLNMFWGGFALYKRLSYYKSKYSRYAPQLPNGWDRVNVRVEHLNPVDADSPCANSPIGLETSTQLPGNSRSVTIHPSVCMEPGKTYKVILTFDKYDPNSPVVSASVLVDSVISYFLRELFGIQSLFCRYWDLNLRPPQ